MRNGAPRFFLKSVQDDEVVVLPRNKESRRADGLTVMQGRHLVKALVIS